MRQKSKQSVTKSSVKQKVSVKLGRPKKSELRTIAETPSIEIQRSSELLPALPSIPSPDDNTSFAEREHIKLLYEAAGLRPEVLQKVRDVLIDALGATAAKDITVSCGQNAGSKVQRVQEDLANYDVRLEAAEKLLKLFDLYPKKNTNINIKESNVVVNPKFIRKK